MQSPSAIKFNVLIIVAAAAVLVTAQPGAAADQPAGNQLCAKRDLQTLVLIEDHGEANDVVPERLAKAGLMQMEARLACSAGHLAEGLALYEEVIGTLGPMNSSHTLNDSGRTSGD